MAKDPLAAPTMKSCSCVRPNRTDIATDSIMPRLVTKNLQFHRAAASTIFEASENWICDNWGEKSKNIHRRCMAKRLDPPDNMIRVTRTNVKNQNTTRGEILG